MHVCVPFVANLEAAAKKLTDLSRDFATASMRRVIRRRAGPENEPLRAFTGRGEVRSSDQDSYGEFELWP